MRVYLDNSSTSFPKPKVVADSIYNYLVNIGGNPGRANHSNALESNRYLYMAREEIASFFNYDKIENVIFTNNITSSLNILINGILKSGDHVITSSMEHNSVIRPLYNLKQTLNIELDIVNANSNGIINVDNIQKAIKPNTKLIVITHASNVTGSIQPIKEIGELCKKNNIYFILDSAQSAGVIDIDFKALSLNALAFTGHKSLLGPQGVGGFIIDDELNKICNPSILGGTGSLSHSLSQPDFLPDKFESGTLNIPGIIGLYEAIKFIKSQGLSTIYEHNNYLRSYLINGILDLGNFSIHGEISSDKSTSCISITHSKLDVSELSYILDSDFNISNRSGLHCAPLAHKTIGTYPEGTVRLSLGYFNTEEEIRYTLDSLNKINSLYK
ncbi:aminotransferase class V-fold PLP-dependent enzyme [Clostridium celatum]|uniref:cysteine desulfurase n=1 Tax=Clostridium celatum DSM 1785 TaxID=545697 RepID=L1QNX7_9CLOT|nr:aminotransferase class V-fold PLP-dependent enzyme [Clostridium celatum]EKY29631.1 cysteine desulfurase family protein [Clostridium celatum DSM 1785]MCE9656610.1 aminotransferase class V-fold PLP-dependent enzyme [Clostridium celatum]MDU2266274.1 aminotransferase class V-fold PLP-dependent enzyme [Clostridium celatum]MDU3722612.1 aminotransferase class V-fold PLP-dependent enzyme [Clostridium celatum]MDU6296120.1 aminotransferase class V-fold PLP-dependent enzyme [Clostridium celatum]